MTTALAQLNAMYYADLEEPQVPYKGDLCTRCIHWDRSRDQGRGLSRDDAPCVRCFYTNEGYPTLFLRWDIDNLVAEDMIPIEAACPQHTFYHPTDNPFARCRICKTLDKGEYGWTRTDAGRRYCPRCKARLEHRREHQDVYEDNATCLNCEGREHCLRLSNEEIDHVLTSEAFAMQTAAECPRWARMPRLHADDPWLRILPEGTGQILDFIARRIADC